VLGDFSQVEIAAAQFLAGRLDAGLDQEGAGTALKDLLEEAIELPDRKTCELG